MQNQHATNDICQSHAYVVKDLKKVYEKSNKVRREKRMKERNKE